MPKHNDYLVVTMLPPIAGSRAVACSVIMHDDSGAPLTKRSAMALVESMTMTMPGTAIAIQKRRNQPGCEWYTVRAYRVDETGKLRRAPYQDTWYPRSG